MSPGAVQLFAASAEVIHQITARREHFPKYTKVYGILNQFGHNVLTSEGHSWRVQRKVTAASFNERNAALVFRESIRQTLGMLDYWAEKRGIGSNMRTLEHDTMRWALNIIGYVGFGLRLPWPNEKMPENADPMSAKYGSVDPPPGYHFSFVEAMGTLLDNVMALLLVPQWLLGTFCFRNPWTDPPSGVDSSRLTRICSTHSVQAYSGGCQIKGGLREVHY